MLSCVALVLVPQYPDNVNKFVSYTYKTTFVTFLSINNTKRSAKGDWAVSTDVLIREDTENQEASGNVSLAGKSVSTNTKRHSKDNLL